MPRHAVCRGGIKALAGKKRLRCIHRDDASVKEQPAAVCILGTEFHVVTDHDNAHAPIRQFFENLCKGDLKIIIHALGRLVQQQNLRVLQQNFRQSRPLLLSAGQIKGMPVEQALQSAEGNHFPDFVRHLMQLLTGEHGKQIFPHVLFHQQHLGILGKRGHPFCFAAKLAAIGLADAGKHGERCALARAVAAEDAQQFARVCLHGHTLQNVRRVLFIAEPHLVKGNERLILRYLCRPLRNLR